MEIEQVKYGYIYIIKIMNFIYIGSGENHNNKNRLETHLTELFYKLKNKEPLTRKLFKAINDFILDISMFYNLSNISPIDFLKAVKQNPNLKFETIKNKVPYTSLKELKIHEQLSIEENNSIDSPNGLNCIRAYRFPEMECNYKRESDMKLIITNPINRVFRKFISDNKHEICNDKRMSFKPIQYTKETNHSYKVKQINLIINEIESNFEMYCDVFLDF